MDLAPGWMLSASRGNPMIGGTGCCLIRRKRRSSHPYVRRERGIFGHFS